MFTQDRYVIRSLPVSVGDFIFALAINTSCPRAEAACSTTRGSGCCLILELQIKVMKTHKIARHDSACL